MKNKKPKVITCTHTDLQLLKGDRYLYYLNVCFIHILWEIQAVELSIKLKDVGSVYLRRVTEGRLQRMITLHPGRQLPVFKRPENSQLAHFGQIYNVHCGGFFF